MSESYFDSEDFKETLSRFLSRKREGVSFYMDSDDFINISDYYLEKGNMEEARGALDIGYRVHPSSVQIKIAYAGVMICCADFSKARNIIADVSVDEDYDVIYLKNVWTSPDGIDYKAKCVYKIELSNDEYVYNNILDTSQLKSAYVLRNDDPIVDGHSGEVWKLSVNTISNYSNSTITYISSASNAIGNALSGCNESVLSSSPMYLGGYASNPVM